MCPDSKDKFENIILSHGTVTRRVELIDENIISNLNKKAESFRLYSLALDESNNIKDTAQLLIFIRGINDTFEITGVFGDGVVERKNTGRGLVRLGVMVNMKLPWS